MEQQQLVTAHFAEMAELTRQMTEVPALVLESGYSYSAFGSWWLTFKKNGSAYRIAFDGKEGWLSLEYGGRVSGGEPPHWRELSRTSSANASPQSVIGLVRGAGDGPAA